MMGKLTKSFNRVSLMEATKITFLPPCLKTYTFALQTVIKHNIYQIVDEIAEISHWVFPKRYKIFI